MDASMTKSLRELIELAADEYLYPVRPPFSPKYSRKVGSVLASVCADLGWPGEGPLMQSVIWARWMRSDCPKSELRAHIAGCEKIKHPSAFKQALDGLDSAPWPKGVTEDFSLKGICNPFSISEHAEQQRRWLVLAGYVNRGNAKSYRIDDDVRHRIAFAAVEVERGLRKDLEALGAHLAKCVLANQSFPTAVVGAFTQALGWWWMAGAAKGSNAKEGAKYGVVVRQTGGRSSVLPIAPWIWDQHAAPQFTAALSDASVRKSMCRFHVEGRPIAPALAHRGSGRDMLIASLFARFMFGDSIATPSRTDPEPDSRLWSSSNCLATLDALNAKKIAHQAHFHDMARRLGIDQTVKLDLAWATRKFCWETVSPVGGSYRYQWKNGRLAPISNSSPLAPARLLATLRERLLAMDEFAHKQPLIPRTGRTLADLKEVQTEESFRKPDLGDLAWWALEQGRPIADLFGLERILQTAMTAPACNLVLKKWTDKVPLDRVLAAGELEWRKAADQVRYWRGTPSDISRHSVEFPKR